MLKPVLAMALLMSLTAQAQAPASRYAEGQIWEYRTRPGDEGSLLKIQRIEPYPNAPASDRSLVYHISVIGVRIGPARRSIPLPHFPVSQATLDASVIRLSGSSARFPEADEGIAMWREAQGGVFTISVAEIAAVAERVLSQQN